MSRSKEMSRSKCLALVASSLAIVLTVSNSSVHSAPVSYKGLKLDMDSDFYGRTKVNVCPSGIRIDSDKLGIVLVSTAPKWNLIAYNPAAKTFYETTLESWRKRIMSGSASKREHHRVVKKQGTVTVGGLKATKYRMVEVLTPEDKMRRRARGDIDLFTLNSIMIPKQAVSILSIAPYLPQDLGMPVRIIQYGRDNPAKGQKTVMDTTKGQTAMIPGSVFAAPKGFRRVSSEVALLMESEDDEMTGMLESLKGAGR